MKVKWKYKSLWLHALWVFGFVSCTEIIDIELDSTYQRLIVYGCVTSDSLHHRVQLSTSSDYFSNKPSPKVENALVELEYGDKLIQLREHDTIPGLYLARPAFRGVPNTTYRLRISQVDVDKDGVFETYNAASTMPPVAQLDSIQLTYFQSPYVSGYQVLMFAHDPPTREWYNFKMWRNGFLLTDTLSKYTVQPDDLYNGKYINGLPVGFLWNDDPDEGLNLGDTITFELNSVDEAYYNFVQDAQLEIMGNNPLFSGPSANIRSNIDNGGKGIFTAYSVQRASAVLAEE